MINSEQVEAGEIAIPLRLERDLTDLKEVPNIYLVQMMQRILLFILVVAVSPMSSQPIVQLSDDQWSEDLSFLEGQVLKNFPAVGREDIVADYSSKLQELRVSLPGISHSERVFKIQEALAGLSDEGCRLHPFQDGLEERVLPVKVQYFDDTLLICDAAKPFDLLKGRKVVGINGKSVKHLFEVMSSSISADNLYYKKYQFQLYGLMKSWLNHFTESTSKDSVEFAFANNEKMRLPFGSLSEYNGLERDSPGFRSTPLGEKVNADRNFWWEYLPDEEALVVQFLRIADEEQGQSISRFISSLLERLEQPGITKLIIDNRYGGGGNGFKFRELTDWLKESEYNRPGRLFVLTGRATRGSVLEMTSVLQLNTRAILVGSETGEGPNTVGDVKTITLPNSGLLVSYTKVFWPTSWFLDKRDCIKPDLKIGFTIRDYLEGRDPVMRAALDYKPEPLSDSNTDESVAMEKWVGKYEYRDRKIEIVGRGHKLFAVSKRKMRSFFEFDLPLYPGEDETLTTDLPDTFIKLSPSGKQIESIVWFGAEI